MWDCETSFSFSWNIFSHKQHWDFFFFFFLSALDRYHSLCVFIYFFMPVLHKTRKSKHGFHAKISKQSCFRLSWVSWRVNWVWSSTANMGKRFHSRRTTCVLSLTARSLCQYWHCMAGPLKKEILALLKSLTIATWVKEYKCGQWGCGSLLALERTVEGSCRWGITPWEKRNFP